MDEIAMLFPDLKIIMAHMGHPWHADTITVIRKHPNVYADVSAQLYRPWQFYNGMRLAYEWGVMHKLLFATDWPITTPEETINALRNFNDFPRKHHLPEVPSETIEEIINRDSLKLLGLGDD
jgi:predicted TIM-barrel fold metal-dependent hydrolase